METSRGVCLEWEGAGPTGSASHMGSPLVSSGGSVSLQAGWSSRYRPLSGHLSVGHALLLAPPFRPPLRVHQRPIPIGQPRSRCALGLQTASVCPWRSVLTTVEAVRTVVPNPGNTAVLPPISQ